MQTVRELAKMGATVILAARGGPARLASAVAAAKAGLDPSAASGITAMSLDLSSFLSIHSFVQEFLAEHTRLHLLINNAGIMACPYGLTEDGLELQMGVSGHHAHARWHACNRAADETYALNGPIPMLSRNVGAATRCRVSGSVLTLVCACCSVRLCAPRPPQTNHFGHFLLTNLLMDTLIASRARIINVASLAHALTARFTYPRQNDRARYDKDTAYADSKLANIYFTLELERRFGSKGVHAYACHPGFVATELMKHAPWALQMMLPPLQYFTFKTSLEGAQTTLFCALSERAVPGGYHSDAQPWPTTATAQDKEKARWMWEESERITKLK